MARTMLLVVAAIAAAVALGASPLSLSLCPPSN